MKIVESVKLVYNCCIYCHKSFESHDNERCWSRSDGSEEAAKIITLLHDIVKDAHGVCNLQLMENILELTLEQVRLNK